MADKYLIKNKLWSPLVIALPEGKSVTLPARGSTELSAQEVQSPQFQRLLADEQITVLNEVDSQNG